MVKSKVKQLQNLLVKSVGDVDIVEQHTTILTAPGEHYGSIMLAIDIRVRRDSGKEETLHLVAKLIPANEMLRLAFDIPVTFKKEVLAYTQALPTLVKFEREFGVPETKSLEHLLPKCYGARVSLDGDQVDENGVLIFENLKIQGYRTEDRLVGFDLETTLLVVRDLARFHAVPVALKLLKPDEFDAKVMPCLEKNKGLEQLPTEVGLAFHNAIMEGAAEIEEVQSYLDRVQSVVDYAAEHPFVDREPPAEPWGTMCHSDYWTSNTMILRDAKGKPTHNKIVDLQIMQYASPVRDLVFFLFTSVVNAVLDQYYERILEEYHNSFKGTLHEFGISRDEFEWDAFLNELNAIAPKEVYHVLVMLKPICTERGKVQNSLEDFQDSDWSRKDLLGPNHRRKLRDTILAFVKRDWI